jgi:hypothetical protein
VGVEQTGGKMRIYKWVAVGLAALTGCGFLCFKEGQCVLAAVRNSDRSFYQEIDKNDWPGDALSEGQTLAAIAHFTDPAKCEKPWSWALIGPDTFLLKGTNYLVERRLNATVPNIGYSKGYWGGVALYQPIPSVEYVKFIVERLASDDCKYEQRVGGKG